MKKILSYLAILCVTLLIFSLSLQDAPTSTNLSISVTEKLLPTVAAHTPEKILPLNNLIREMAHVLEFFILGLFSMFAFTCSTYTFSQSSGLTLFYTSLVAVLDECIQYTFSPGRAFQFIDLIKDFFGVCSAIILFALLYKLYRFTYTKFISPFLCSQG